MNKDWVINKFKLTKTQTEKIERFVLEMFRFNKHTNIVGKSTLENVWERHIADSLQLSLFVSEKNSKIFFDKKSFKNCEISDLKSQKLYILPSGEVTKFSLNCLIKNELVKININSFGRPTLDEN